jgi:hypothetical protein
VQALVVLHPNGAPEVKLNEQAELVATIQVRGAVASGEPVTAARRPRAVRGRRRVLARCGTQRLMVHLAINEGDADHDVVHWLTPVTDEEYAAASSARPAHSASRASSSAGSPTSAFDQSSTTRTEPSTQRRLAARTSRCSGRHGRGCSQIR